ncbi:MAG: MFS transporter [Pseudomonadota bacterium]
MNTNTPLKRNILLAFSLPGIMQGFMHAPEAQVQGIYAAHAGLSLVALASVLLLTRLFDGLTYPLIGYLTDRTFRNTGSRKPWILAGTVVTVIGLWFLYRPPPNVTITYFGIWMTVTYVGWKLTEIPYIAWSFGLSRDYVERARIQMWRGIAMLTGGLVFFLVPFITKSLGITPTTELNFKTLAFTALVIVVCVPAMNLYALAKVPDGEAAPPQIKKPRQSLRELVMPILRNGPLLRLLLAIVPASMVASMSASTSYLFVTSYLGLGKHYAAIMLIVMPFSLLSLPFWGWMCIRFERHRVAAIALVLTAVSSAGIGFLQPGEASLIPLMILNPIAIFCFTALVVAIPAMIGDVSDHGRLQSGEDQSGIYSAVYSFMTKSIHGIGAAAGLGLAGWIGFDATVTHQSTEGVFAIKLVTAWLPLLGAVISAFLLWTFPITRAKQAETQAALKALDEKTASAV